jgi:hypothetical protein
MKKLSFLILLIFIAINSVIAQTTTTTTTTTTTPTPTTTTTTTTATSPPATVTPTKIEYDFDGKDIRQPNPSLNQMKPGGFYQIIVHNINGNLFKVSINVRDTTTSQALQMPTFTSLDIAGISSAIAGISAPQTSIITQKVLSAAGGRSTGPPQYTTKKLTVTNSVGVKLQDYKNTLNGFLGRLTALKQKLDKLQFDVYNYELNQVNLVPDPTITINYKQTVAAVVSLRGDMYQLQNDVSSSQTTFNAYIDDKTVKAEIAKDDALAAASKAITDSYTKLLTGCSDLLTAGGADKSKDLLTGLINIQNNANMDYTSLPFQFRNDQAKMVLIIEPRNASFGLNTYKHEIDFPLARQHYAGVGVSFYTSNLHDEAYSTVGTKVDTTTTYAVKKENYAKMEVGVAALLKLGSKNSEPYDSWGYHFSIGPGLSLGSSVKPRVLTGGGFSYGSRHMFTIDGGLIAGYVNVLSTTVDLNNTMLTTAPTSVVVSKLKAGGFIALGYLYRFQ